MNASDLGITIHKRGQRFRSAVLEGKRSTFCAASLTSYNTQTCFQNVVEAGISLAKPSASRLPTTCSSITGGKWSTCTPRIHISLRDLKSIITPSLKHTDHSAMCSLSRVISLNRRHCTITVAKTITTARGATLTTETCKRAPDLHKKHMHRRSKARQSR